ncbi:MAG: TonB-dependent receptor [Alphaproteobacteria bacterium]|nr:TonB-dependent receptor [Alphaproteobacteria bacterium]
MKLLTAASIAALCLWPLSVLAQSENVIVTATRLSAQDAGSNVSVIDAATIAAHDPSSVVDLLRDLPGVFVQQSGGRGSVVSVFTRGAKPNFTLVLLDGVKANDPTNTRGGSYDFSTLDLNDIERIEFVRGPASAVYGSDAVGGVINIISRRGGETFDAGLQAEGGSFGYVRAAGHVGGPIGAATGNIGLSYTDNGMPVAGSTLKSTALDGALALPEIGGTAINLTGRYSDSTATSFPDSSGGPRLSVLRTLDHRDIQEGVLGAHALRGITGWWTMVLDYGFYDRASDAVSPGVAASAQTPTGIPANGDKARFNRHEVTWTNRLTPLPGLEAALGVDMQADHGVDDGFLQFAPARLPTRFALDRTLWAGFAEARYQVMPQLSLSASGRYDDTGATHHFSPQLRADYALTDWGTQFQLLWGKAYKLPSFYALGNPIVGDPGLKPEEAENFEAGVTQKLWNFGRWKVEAYATNYRDLIDFRPGAVPKLINLSTVHVRGIETSLELTWGTLSATPRLSYTNAHNTLTGAALRDVPSWLAGATVNWRPDPAWNVSFDLNHTGRMTDNAVPTGDVALPGHVRADLAVSYKVLPNLALKLGVDNIFDRRYEDVVGFPAPGVVMRGGVSASL